MSSKGPLVTIRRLEEIDEVSLERMLTRREWNDPEILTACSSICDAVRLRGDAALYELTARLDGFDACERGLRIPSDELEDAASAVDATVRAALDEAIANITRFHEGQRPDPLEMQTIAPGIQCGERTTPIDSVCLYVPRGRGAFSSVAAMLGVPARLAGVPRVVMCTPPGPDGRVDPATLYVASKLGIEEVLTLGGAQAIAAVAWGSESVPRCDKVVGPGNVWVSAARQLLTGVIDTGPPAGPSESLVVSDGSAPAENVAWNLMIEAEHGENSWALLLTHDADHATAVAAAVERQSTILPQRRRAFVERVLSERGGIVITKSLYDSVDFANRFAAEHVALMVSDPWPIARCIRNAGEVLVGDYPIFSLANYAMGINAILPTAGLARSHSGISVRDFVKRTSIGYVTRQGFERLRGFVPTLSRDEGFNAHHEAIERWLAPTPPVTSETEP